MGTEDPHPPAAGPSKPDEDYLPPATQATEEAGSEDWLLTDEEIALVAQAVKMFRDGTLPPAIRGHHTNSEVSPPGGTEGSSSVNVNTA